MPRKTVDNYKLNYRLRIDQYIEDANMKTQVNYSAIQRFIKMGPSIPDADSKTLAQMDETKEIMNKIMKKYID